MARKTTQPAKPSTAGSTAPASEAAQPAAATAPASEAAKPAAATAPASEAAQPAAESKGEKAAVATLVPALRVTSLREGFRRGGRSWSKEATTVKLSDLTEEQIEQIKGEAMLVVEEVNVAE